MLYISSSVVFIKKVNYFNKTWLQNQMCWIRISHFWICNTIGVARGPAGPNSKIFVDTCCKWFYWVIGYADSEYDIANDVW